jgi:hypothetical protein
MRLLRFRLQLRLVFPPRLPLRLQQLLPSLLLQRSLKSSSTLPLLQWVMPPVAVLQRAARVAGLVVVAGAVAELVVVVELVAAVVASWVSLVAAHFRLFEALLKLRLIKPGSGRMQQSHLLLKPGHAVLMQKSPRRKARGSKQRLTSMRRLMPLPPRQ